MRPLSGCVMCCQNVWVTVNCPATQTIEGERVGLSKVPSNILSWVQLVCLYSGCYDRLQEITSEIRPDSQEMPSFVPRHFEPAFDASLFFMLEFYCWRWTFQTLCGWTLIRLAAGHSLEISYAVWACLYWAVIFGELIMEVRTVSPFTACA